jgi:large subunit ribosomal protein L5
MSRLKEKYNKEIKKALQDQFKYKNPMQVPKLERITLNCVTRDCVSNGKLADNIMGDLAQITGQKAVIARAKNSIATFKVREGQALGAYVTLRGKRMYEFLDRLINLSLPRVKDFRGLSPKAFDGRGNYNLGVKEQIMFPEINYDKIDKVRGLGITITTTAKTNEEGRALLKEFGMPFKK